MTKEAKMETIMPQTDKQDVEAVLELLSTMNLDEQKEILAFLRGVQFSRSLGTAV